MTSQPTSPVLAQHVMLCGHDGGSQVEAVFEYDSRDPFAVWITFGSGANSIRWAMSRSLLAQLSTRTVVQQTGQSAQCLRMVATESKACPRATAPKNPGARSATSCRARDRD